MEVPERMLSLCLVGAHNSRVEFFPLQKSDVNCRDFRWLGKVCTNIVEIDDCDEVAHGWGSVAGMYRVYQLSIFGVGILGTTRS